MTVRPGQQTIIVGCSLRLSSCDQPHLSSPFLLATALLEYHCLCLPSGFPSQGDPKNQAMKLPDHTNSQRLARDAQVLGPSAALNRDPTTTPSVNDSFQT